MEVLWSRGRPACLVAQHGIEDDEDLSPASNQGLLAGIPAARSFWQWVAVRRLRRLATKAAPISGGTEKASYEPLLMANCIFRRNSVPIA